MFALWQVSNWFANARRRLKNTVRQPDLSWALRIKLYNKYVQGNAERLSVSSDDSCSEGDLLYIVIFLYSFASGQPFSPNLSVERTYIFVRKCHTVQTNLNYVITVALPCVTRGRQKIQYAMDQHFVLHPHGFWPSIVTICQGLLHFINLQLLQSCWKLFLNTLYISYYDMK